MELDFGKFEYIDSINFEIKIYTTLMDWKKAKKIKNEPQAININCPSLSSFLPYLTKILV